MSHMLTLDDVVLIGQNELFSQPPIFVQDEKRRVPPIHEMLSKPNGALTETNVRLMVRAVLSRLAELPEGTWTDTSFALNIGGVEQRTVSRDRITLSFRLQADASKLETVLHVGGYIEEAQKTMTGR